MTTDGLSRRHALTGAATIGLSASLLAACGDDTATDPTPGGGEPSNGDSSGPGGEPQVLTSTSEIAVGGGTIFAEERVVVTQPTEGEFKAFSSTCTHQACQVGEVAEGTINCPCHASKFSISDGSVQGGPAPTPLPEVEITVKGDQISLA